MADVGINGRAKRQKTSEADPSSNPYLAHMYENGGADQSNGNGYGGGHRNGRQAISNGTQPSGGLKSIKRHSSTAEQAQLAEDGPANPFTGNPLSERYFSILRTRRNLPVHAQRSVAPTEVNLCLR